MAEITKRGTTRKAIARARTRSSDADADAALIDEYFRMPTLAEIVAAGYPPSDMKKIKAERDELVQRFRTDPEFRAWVIEDTGQRRASRR